MGVLEKDGGTSGKEIKGGLNSSSRLVEGVSSTTVDSQERKLIIIIETSLKSKERQTGVGLMKSTKLLISLTKCSCCSFIVSIMALSLLYA